MDYSYDESGRIKVRSVVDLPSLRTEVRIARRGSTVDQKIEDWAMKLLEQLDRDETGP